MIKVSRSDDTSLGQRAAKVVLDKISMAETNAKLALEMNCEVVHALAAKLIETEEVSGAELDAILSNVRSDLIVSK